MWLTGRLAPDFKTIADFRKDNGPAIRATCCRFIYLCRRLELFSYAVAAIDGSKFKAVNARDKNFTKAKLNKRMDNRVGRGTGRGRPTFFETHIVRRQHAHLPRTLPARLARLGIGTQEVAGVERDQPPETGQCRLLDPDSLPEFECNGKCLGPRTPLVPPSWLGRTPGAVVRGALSGSRARVHS